MSTEKLIYRAQLEWLERNGPRVIGGEWWIPEDYSLMSNQEWRNSVEELATALGDVSPDWSMIHWCPWREKPIYGKPKAPPSFKV